nr:MAG: putative coat protein [Leviviridae sp.]
MTFPNPLVITLGGSGGTAKTLVRINQDAYGSEHLLRDPGVQEWRAKVRHTRETPAAGQLPIERHNVTFTWEVYGADGAPSKIREAYVVIRDNKVDTVDDVADLVTALSYFLTDTLAKDLIGWAS